MKELIGSKLIMPICSEEITEDNIVKSLSDANKFAEFNKMQIELIEQQSKEQINKLTIDTIMLIKENYFKDYNTYKEWVNNKNENHYKEICQDKSRKNYVYIVPIPILEESIFNYIKEKYVEK